MAGPSVLGDLVVVGTRRVLSVQMQVLMCLAEARKSRLPTASLLSLREKIGELSCSIHLGIMNSLQWANSTYVIKVY